ncbi:MAG: hypothetical protein WC219_01250 [Acholeplasmataceae bacterium]
MKSNGLCIYIEQLRSARNISQLSFVEDVVSLRQYRRYLKGESDIPFNIVHQLTAKLGMKTDNILREFEVAKIEETKKMNKLYNYVVNYAFNEFNILKKELSEDHIIESSNLLLFKHTIIISDYYQKKINIHQVKEMNVDLINYPQILDQGILNTIELLILTFLIDVVSLDEQKRIIEKIYKYVNDEKMIISGGNEKVLTLILARLAKYSGILQSFEQVIKFCDVGIERNKTLFSYYLMDYFYYYKSLAYHKLGDQKNYENSLNKVFNILEFEGNENKMKKFIKLINEDYDIDFKHYVLDLYKKNEEGNL